MPGIDECLLQAMAVPGARGAALVDWSSGLALGTIGESPVGDHETTAAETAELARAAAEYETFSAPGPPPAAPRVARAALGPGPSARAAIGPAASALVPAFVPGVPPKPVGPPPPPPPFQGGNRAPAAPAADHAPPVEDVIVTTRSGYHVLRFVETSFDSSVFLHLWLDRDTGNLALARIRLRDLAGRLVLG